MVGQFTVVQITNLKEIVDSKYIKVSRINNDVVVVSNEIQLYTRGLLFPTGTILDPLLLKELNLFKDNTLNKNIMKHGIMSKSGVVKPKLIRGVLTSALFLPFNVLENYILLKNISCLNNNTKGFSFNYITITIGIDESFKTTLDNPLTKLNKQFKRDIIIKPMFSDFKGLANSNPVVITEMLEGYSGRCGFLKVDQKDNFINKLKTLFSNKIRDYKFVYGNKFLMFSSKFGTSYDASKLFKYKLNKGETIYYTAVGFKNEKNSFVPNFNVSLFKHILGSGAVSTLKNCYGDNIPFTYSYKPGTYDVFIHRITNTLENGKVIDLSWSQVKKRCSKLNVSHVPEIGLSYFKTNFENEQVYEDIKLVNYGTVLTLDKILSNLSEKKSNLDKKSLTKGLVLRIENGDNSPIFYKYLNNTYNLISSIRKKQKYFINFKEDEV
jgi:hypothetical protein